MMFHRVVREGEVMQIPSGVPHQVEALEESAIIDVFSPIRQDWLEKTDTHFERWRSSVFRDALIGPGGCHDG